MKAKKPTRLRVEFGRETDGRWFADVVDLPGVMAYGVSRHDALAKATALAQAVAEEKLEHGEEAAGSGLVSTEDPPRNVEVEWDERLGLVEIIIAGDREWSTCLSVTEALKLLEGLHGLRLARRGPG